MTTIELREKRANIWSQMQEMRDAVDKDGWTAELRASWDKADTELTDLTADIEREEKNDTLTKRYAAIDDAKVTVDRSGDATNDTGRYERTFEKFVRQGLNELDVEERQLLQANFRAQGTTTGGAGGYTVPEGFWAKVTETMKFFGGVLGYVEEITTEAGNDLPWPTNNDTGNTGAILAENTQITEQDVTFGVKTLGAYTYTSKLIRVSLQLLQDSGVDIEGFLSRRIGERLGRIANTHLTTGTGSSQPQGFITGATVGKTTANSTAITYDELIDLIHSVDVAYRTNGARFEMNDAVVAYVRKIRDDSGGAGIGRPIWEPSVQVGQPDSLLGYAVTVNNDMAATITATDKTIAFGDFNAAYVARRVNGGQVMRLAERYADYLQVGFFGFQRLDGLVQDASAIKVLQQKA